MKPKALLFYQYLPPWRIDIFNEISNDYALTIVFTDADSDGFTYNRQELLSLLRPDIQIIFLSSGFRIGSRPVRTGVVKLLQKTKPDVVFAHEYSFVSICIALSLASRLFRFKFVITTSDNKMMTQSSKGFKALARNLVLKYSDGLIVYSSEVKNTYQELYPKLTIGVCPNIQDEQKLLSRRFIFDEFVSQHKKKFNIRDEKIILYVGRLNHIKGIDLLINAFYMAKVKNARLVLVGEGQDKDNLEKLVRSKNLDSKVIFAGFYSGNELYAWYDLASLLVLPSRYEPFGAVVNEALIFGCPVLISKYAGATDFIQDEVNGWIMDPLNEDEFTSKFIYAMESSTKFKSSKSSLMLKRIGDYARIFKHIIE